MYGGVMKVAILTISDKGYEGKRKDESGKIALKMMKEAGAEIIDYEILPDEEEMIKMKLINLCDREKVDLILTSGGTGFSPRDVTPEATLKVIERQAPGLAEAMRASSLKFTPHAMLSRAVSGIRGKTLIINLPGSPKGVRECLEVVLPVLFHAIEILTGRGGECATR